MEGVNMSHPECGQDGPFELSNTPSAEEASFSVKPQPNAVPLHQRQQALKEFDREAQVRLSSRPESGSVVLENARVLIDVGDVSLAKNLLVHTLQSNAYDTEAIKLMAKAQELTGEVESASELLQALVRIDPSAESYFLLAELFYNLEDNESALQNYLIALESMSFEDHRIFDLYKNVGNTFIRLGDNDSAEEFYKKALTVNPDSDVLQVNFGTLCIRNGQLSEAAEHFRAAVSISEANDKAWTGLALVHREFGDLELGLGNVEKALDINPINETAMTLLFQWGVSAGELNRVGQRLKSFLDHDSENVEMSFNLAKVFVLKGQHENAQIELERCLSLAPTHEEANRLNEALNRGSGTDV